MKMVKSLILIITMASSILVLLGGCMSSVSARPLPQQSVTKEYSEAVGDETFGIRISKNYVSGFYPGALADIYTEDDPEGYFKKGEPMGVIIINHTDAPKHFRLTPVQPNQLEIGYAKAPDYVLKEWVIIGNLEPVLGAREAQLIPVGLWMPPNAQVFAQKWEFRILIEDLSQTGFVRTATECRWLVEMRED